jgi:hypothetical protein
MSNSHPAIACFDDIAPPSSAVELLNRAFSDRADIIDISDVKQLMALVRTRPTVVVTEYRWRDSVVPEPDSYATEMDGIRLAQRIHARRSIIGSPSSYVILFTTFTVDELPRGPISALGGPDIYINKAAAGSAQQLRDAVEQGLNYVMQT